ncbi:hypothetical protein V8G54_026730 [Vigna mungo]|uniref:Uncharacterized protein n=1 Tax=Vigna mungo TaxID=3915 RepID=A0AAQ3RQQ9_VIGMU
MGITRKDSNYALKMKPKENIPTMKVLVYNFTSLVELSDVLYLLNETECRYIASKLLLSKEKTLSTYLIFHKGTVTVCIWKVYYAGDMMLTSFVHAYSTKQKMNVSDSVISPA